MLTKPSPARFPLNEISTGVRGILRILIVEAAVEYITYPDIEPNLGNPVRPDWGVPLNLRHILDGDPWRRHVRTLSGPSKTLGCLLGYSTNEDELAIPAGFAIA